MIFLILSEKSRVPLFSPYGQKNKIISFRFSVKFNDIYFLYFILIKIFLKCLFVQEQKKKHISQKTYQKLKKNAELLLAEKSLANPTPEMIERMNFMLTRNNNKSASSSSTKSAGNNANVKTPQSAKTRSRINAKR